MTEEANLFLSKLVLQGESILAEIFRLSSFVPKDFRDPTKSTKFRSIVQLDFKYLSKKEQIEKDLEKNLRLQSHFYSSFQPVLIAFEQLFSSIAEFVQTFTKYAKDFYNVEKTDVNRTAELEAYCLYISGLLLIYLDMYLPGPIRERIYIAIYRKSDVRENAEFLVDFLKEVSASNDSMISRIPLPEKFIRSTFHTIEVMEESSLPTPKTHLMYVALQFDRQTLSNDSARMTKIVNSIFRETWVLNLGFGAICNVFDGWYNYKSAWNALNATITQQEAYRLLEKHQKVVVDTHFPKVINEMVQFNHHLQQITAYNRSLKWLYLHSRPSQKTTRPLKNRPITDDQLFKWLLDVSRFELLALNLYKTTIENRETEGNRRKQKIRTSLNQLAEFFEHGFVKMGETQKNNFVKWVRSLSETVEKIDLNDAREGVETVQQITRRVKQVGELLGLSINMTLKECLSTLDSDLRSLLSVLSLSDSIVPDLYAKMEGTYLWPLISQLTPRIQKNLVDTSNTDVVRQIFTKLSISCWILKLKLSEFSDRDNVANRIANTYSYSLEKHLKTVLQSVPQHMFEIMYKVIMPGLGKKFEPYIDKTELREIGDFISSSKLVETTSLIASTSMGISRMMLTRVGTIEINPKELLEEGMIRQLYKELKKLLSNSSATASIESLLKTCESVETLRSSFFYICDYMNLNGERIWSVAMDDYFSRISEERAFAKSSGELDKNEIAALFIRLTNPKVSRYCESTLSWMDLKLSKNILHFDIFYQIENIIPFHVLTSIETNVTVELEKLLNEYISSARQLGVSYNLQNAVSHQNSYQFFSGATYEQLVKTIQPQSPALGSILAQIGQYVLILRTICNAKQLANRHRDDVVQRDLLEINKSLTQGPKDLPAEMGTILKLMMQYSIYNPERMVFRLKDEPSPIFLIALIQCLLPKIGDHYFVCPVQLEFGIRLVLRQSRLLPYFLPIIHEQLPACTRPKKRIEDVDRFLKRIVENL
ncbi:hypothetical protein L3Y34_015723 [Caenorhabditis briggsae]|uniref:Uncharacterized protein n=1 Tax=Caenorhabditis briggsae TaxID=6238 RepID=A0AAE9IZG2_CAEBR|nr:hypothetical protein L3Y34_015723 [Caenorhabditis briggsae]